MNLFRSIFNRIYLSYSLLIFFLIAFICTIVFIVFTHDIQDNKMKDMTNVTRMISEQLDLRVKEMNQISYGVLANTNVRQSLLYLSGYNYDSVNMLVYLSAYSMITDSIFTISQPFPDIDRVNVFSDNNIFFSSKRFNNESDKIRIHMLTRVRPPDIKTDKDAEFMLITPHLDEWVDDNKEVVFSLQRIVKGSHGPIGLIEVQENHKIISDICNIDNIDIGHVYIMDQEGNAIYPLTKSTPDKIKFFMKWFKTTDHNKEDNERIHKIYDEYTKTKQVVVSSFSDYTNWMVIYVLPEDYITGPIYKILKLILIIGLIGAFISFLIAYMIASHIYTPLRELKKKVEDFDYQDLNLNKADVDHTFNKSDAEIALLNNTFDTMAIKLKKSIEETIETRSHVQRAYYKVLQSQINPHFLHNTISVISIMAKNLGDRKIPDICKKLNNLLKYTSDSSEDYVTISEEKENILAYLGLLQYRYEHRLEYFIEIDPALSNIKVPRMTFQPFVENSLKHGLYGINRAITIHIEGKRVNNGWEIIIKDNGTGIKERELSELLRVINLFNNSNTWLTDNPHTEVKGLGVLNTVMRLKILFGNSLVFEIGNGLKGGTEIRIHVSHYDFDE